MAGWVHTLRRISLCEAGGIAVCCAVAGKDAFCPVRFIVSAGWGIYPVSYYCRHLMEAVYKIFVSAGWDIYPLSYNCRNLLAAGKDAFGSVKIIVSAGWGIHPLSYYCRHLLEAGKDAFGS